MLVGCFWLVHLGHHSTKTSFLCFTASCHKVSLILLKSSQEHLPLVLSHGLLLPGSTNSSRVIFVFKMEESVSALFSDFTTLIFAVIIPFPFFQDNGNKTEVICLYCVKCDSELSHTYLLYHSPGTMKEIRRSLWIPCLKTHIQILFFPLCDCSSVICFYRS